jgi:hypothetical protein
MESQMYCPHCGKPIMHASDSWSIPRMFGFEYISQSRLFGIPLIHVAFGYNPHTGLPRVARGVIAIGNFAFGLIAIGGIAAGGLVLSGIGVGLLALAGIAVGWVTVGGIAVGATYAFGGLAFSLWHAKGGLPLILNMAILPSFASLFHERNQNLRCPHNMAHTPPSGSP